MKEYSANNQSLKNGSYEIYKEQPIYIQEHENNQQERINNIIKQAQSFFKNEDYEASIIKLKLAIEKINYMKQNKRQYDRKIELVCIYNLAATYQKQWNLDECIPLLQKICNLVRSLLQQNLKSSEILNQQDYQNKHWFKLKSLLIKSELQYCAVLSQIGEHKKAFKIAINLTSEIKTLFKKSGEQCTKLIGKRQSQIIKSKNNEELRSSQIGMNDKIEFSLNVLMNANKTLQQLSNISTYNELSESAEVQAQMKQTKQKLYYWKNNPQNNIKMIRQTFNNEKIEVGVDNKTSSHRNILGIKRSHNSWLQQFTISKVMFMTFINYLELCDADNLIFQFNQRNIMQKVIYLSVSYFSLSIQLRFLQQQQNEKNSRKQDGNSNKRNKHKDNRLNQKQLSKSTQKEVTLKISQIFHLKSIQVFCKYIKENSAFVNHLVLNYHKHYKINLNTIHEQNSLAEYSVLYDMANPISQLSTKVYRKDSVYYEQEKSQKPSEISLKSQQISSNVSSNISSFKKIQKNNSQEDLQEVDLSKHPKKIYSQSQKIKCLFSSTQFGDKTMKKVTSSTKIVTLKMKQVNQLVDRSQKSMSSRNQSNLRQRDKSNSSKSKNFLKSSVTLKQNKSQSPMKQKSHKIKQGFLKESRQVSRQQSIKKSTSHHALDILKKSGNLNEMKQRQSNKQIGNAGSERKKK